MVRCFLQNGGGIVDGFCDSFAFLGSLLQQFSSITAYQTVALS